MREGLARTGTLMIAALLTASGCGGKQPEVQDQVAAAKPTGPDREVFAPLDKARLDHRLPVVIGGEDVECFQSVGDVIPEEADPLTREMLREQSAAVSRAVLSWLAAELGTAGVPRALVENWSVEVLEPVVLEIPRERVRFAEDFAENPACLTGMGWLPKGRDLAVALLGVRRLGFKAQLPLAPDVQNALMETLGLENMVLESEALFLYEAALGGDGQPLLTPEGQPLFTAPSGEFITQDQVPPPEKRMMGEWEVHSEAPLWFAYRAFPDDAWRREGDENRCSVILIPEDLNPQAPDCAEFGEAAFTVSIIEGEDEPVSLTITTGTDQFKGVMMRWGKVAKVQVDDRIVLWLKPRKVTVGVELLVNSLVLNPRPLAVGAAGDDADYAVAGGWQDEESAVGGEAADEAEAGRKPKPKKPARRKGKVSDEDLLDEYLRD